MRFVDVTNDIAFRRIFGNIAEQDERGRLELAEERGEQRATIKAVLGLHSNKIPVSIIASSLNLTELEVTQIIENSESI